MSQSGSGPVGFDRLQHFVRVPVRLGGTDLRFLVDTGIGVTVVSSAVAGRADVEATGTAFSGRRMSGQEVTAPMVRLPALRLGDLEVTGHEAAVVDLGEAEGPAAFDGIVGLDLVDPLALTVDPAAETLVVGAAPDLGPDDAVLPLDIRRHGPSYDPFLPLVLPSGRTVVVELDTGSAALILDTRYLGDCGLAPGDEALATTTGTDETGYTWTRHRATVSGSIHLAAAPATAQARPATIFQEIIHDGLVGTDYLDRYRYTVDVGNGRLVLAPLA